MKQLEYTSLYSRNSYPDTEIVVARIGLSLGTGYSKYSTVACVSSCAVLIEGLLRTLVLQVDIQEYTL